MKIEGRYNNYDRYMPNRPVHSSEIKDESIKISSASSVNLSETTQKISITHIFGRGSVLRIFFLILRS